MKIDATKTILIYLMAYGIVATIMGLITEHINENKGYRGGFAWGFFLGTIGIIVVACRSNNNVLSVQKRAEEKETAETLINYKKLLDSGVITEAEFESKKNELLKL